MTSTIPNNIPQPIADQAIENFSYDLPNDRIAWHPLSERDSSKLLVFDNGMITGSHFWRLPKYLKNGSLIVFNNTRVVQARLEFFKGTGARIEIFCLNPELPTSEISTAMQQNSPVVWRCLIGNAKKWKQGGLSIINPENGFELKANTLRQEEGEYLVEFSWNNNNLNFADVLELVGKTPLPPYITRQADDSDKATYQTVYAKTDGSVAAPTAGLHFTERVFEELENQGIKKGFVTLHVGAGTFKPVTGSSIGQHQMHGEQFVVKKDFLELLLTSLGNVTSVGTTSMRTLESLYWIGARLLAGKTLENGLANIDQWEPYQGETKIETKDAIKAIIEYLTKHNLDSVSGETSLIIVPGYHFKVVDLLVTNFHQPKSTLLCLVAAFAGPHWKKAYDFALENGYRFLSYGDSCLFIRQNGHQPF